MNLGNIGLTLAIVVATTGATAHAGEHRKAAKEDRRAAADMQAVAVAPLAGEPGHGWRYFSDVREARAVVISPNSDYYYSRGKGLRLVYRSAPTA